MAHDRGRCRLTAGRSTPWPRSWAPHHVITDPGSAPPRPRWTGPAGSGADPGGGATRLHRRGGRGAGPLPRRRHLAVVPQGGNTGPGGRRRAPATTRSCSTCAGSTSIGAGRRAGPPGDRRGRASPLAALHRAAAEPHGLTYAVDFAARDTATVGGTIATNAGGVHVLRWGTTRAQVAGHRGGAGRRSRAAPPGRPDQGQHRLRPGRPAVRQRGHPGRGHRGPAAPGAPTNPTACVALVGFGSVADAVAAVVAAGGRPCPGSPPPSSCWPTGSTWCARPSIVARRWPAPGRSLVLVEARADVDGAAAAVLGRRPGAPTRRRGRLGGGAPTAAGAEAAVGLPPRPHAGHQHARAAPQAGRDPAAGRPGRLRGRRAPTLVAGVAPEAQVWQFGHLGDGNIHVNVTGLDPDDETRRRGGAAAWWPRRGGSISAEHGIGAAKRALAGASAARRPRSTRSAAIKARARPRAASSTRTCCCRISRRTTDRARPAPPSARTGGRS